MSFPLTLLCWVNVGVVLEESVKLAGDIADQAASDLAVGLAIGAASLRVGAGRRVMAQPGQDNHVQGLVELPVPGAVESNPDPLARGGGDRRRAAQHGEGGVGAAATPMRPGALLH